MMLLSPSIFTTPDESATNTTSALTSRFISVISVNVAVRTAILPFPSKQSLHDDRITENTIAKKLLIKRFSLTYKLILEICELLVFTKLNEKYIGISFRSK